MFVRPLVAAIAFFAAVGVARANVSIKFDGSKVHLKSDDTAHVVVVEGVGRFGECVVYVDGVPKATLDGARDLRIDLGDGDDKLLVNGLQIGGSLKIRTGAGSDVVLIQSDRTFETAKRAVFVGKDVDVALGGQPKDQCAVEADDTLFGITIGGTLTVRDATDLNMEAAGVVADDAAGVITIGGDLVLRQKSSSDANGDDRTTHLDGVRVGGATKLELSADADFVSIRGCAFARSFKAKLGGGNDQLAISPSSESSSFHGAVDISGGSGSEDLVILVGADFAVPPTIVQFEITG